MIVVANIFFQQNTRWGNSRFTAMSEQIRVYSLLFINYFIIFHMNNCNPTFSTLSIQGIDYFME